MNYSVVYSPVFRKSLPDATTETSAVDFARSESGVLHTSVSLWYAGELVAAFENGTERDLSKREMRAVEPGLRWG